MKIPVHLLAVVAVPSALLACRPPQASGPPPTPVKIQVAQAVPIDDSSEYVATLKSRGSAAIMPQVEGHITHIYVRSGARVAAGEALMQIDPRSEERRVGKECRSRWSP